MPPRGEGNLAVLDVEGGVREEAEIARVQNRLEVATADQAQLDEATINAMERVRPVLGFFGESMGKVDTRVANDKKGDHPPSIIVDESLLKTG